MTRPLRVEALLAVLVYLLFSCTAASAASIGPDNHILVDLSHAERITIDGTVATGLDLSKSPVVVEWQAWADDMRRQGYTVTTHITGPITKEVLGDACILIIAEPDYRKSGVAYFTTDEAKAISTWVSEGHTLLLQGQSFLGGGDAETYVDDYGSRYVYALIINDLLKKMSIGLKFTAGTNTRPIGDIVLDPDATDMIAGSVSDIWIHEGAKSHPVWSGVTGGRFALFHGASINTPWNSASVIARGDAKSFSTRDTVGVQLQDPYVASREEEGLMKRVEDITTRSGTFRLIVKKQGEYPVVMAETKHGCGTVVLYGDVAAWQDSAYWGPVYTNASYNNQKIASNLMAYLKKRCVDCEKTLATPVPTATRTSVTQVPPSQVQEDCQDCLDTCVENAGLAGGKLDGGVTGVAHIGWLSGEQRLSEANYMYEYSGETVLDCLDTCIGSNGATGDTQNNGVTGVAHIGWLSGQQRVSEANYAYEHTGVTPTGTNGSCVPCAEECDDSPPNSTEYRQCYSRCLSRNACSCPGTTQSCTSCVNDCVSGGDDEAGNWTPWWCINECAGYEKGPDPDSYCYYCRKTCESSLDFYSCYGDCIVSVGCTCPEITPSCDSCIGNCDVDGATPAEREDCINACSGIIGLKNECRACASICPDTGTALGVECYSHCMLQNGCTCPSTTTQSCDSCIGNCDVDGATPAEREDCINECSGISVRDATLAGQKGSTIAAPLGGISQKGSLLVYPSYCTPCSSSCPDMGTALGAECYSHCMLQNGCTCPVTTPQAFPVQGCDSCLAECDKTYLDGPVDWGPAAGSEEDENTFTENARECYAGCMGMSSGQSCSSCTADCSELDNGLLQANCYSHCARTNACVCPDTSGNYGYWENQNWGTPAPTQTASTYVRPGNYYWTPTATPTVRATVTRRVTAAPRITLTPTPALGICSACLLECRGQRGASYTKCLGDCAAESGLERNFCMPTLVPVTPSATVTATPSGAVCWGDFCILPGQQQQPQQNCRQVCGPDPNCQVTPESCPTVCRTVCT